MLRQKRMTEAELKVSELQEDLKQTHTLQCAVQDALASMQEAQRSMASDLATICQLLNTPRDPSIESQLVTPTTDLSVQPDSGPEEHDQGDKSSPFTVVQSKRRRRKKIVVGTEDCCESFRGAPEVRSVFVWNVSKDTSVEQVRSHIEKNCDGVVSVRQWSHKDAPRKSFKVTVLKDSVQVLLNSDFPWPKYVKARRFTPRRMPPTHFAK